MKINVSKNNPPIGVALVANAVKKSSKISLEWGQNTSYDIGDNVILTTSSTIMRYLARSNSGLNLYPSDILDRTEADHWLTFSTGPIIFESFDDASIYSTITADGFLIGNSITVADYALFGGLYANTKWQEELKQQKPELKVLISWYNKILNRPEVKETISGLPKDLKFTAPQVKKQPTQSKPSAPAVNKGKSKGDQTKQGGKVEGKFVDLPGAEMGKVIVRFPPEASGYLHIGHAKAVLLNQHYRNMFQGKLILRFDDTNPAKEKEEYEDVIIEDLKMLEVKHDYFSKSSDHFETMLNYCEKLIKEGKAFADNTDPETMKSERESLQPSKCRGNSIEKNLNMWEEMKKGTEFGKTCALRAKVDYQSKNGCMRDPTIYRCKPESHPVTGDKYKVYPTYDFTCPIVDSIEGVTHALRTTEYMDRDEQYNWFIDALGLRKPHIYAYSRLSMTNTVMSKRKLTWFVDSGLVEGWDDPRFPTVRGVLRRGLTIEALKQFIISQGSSRSVVFMEWDKIWAMNKKVIDPIAPRYTTIDLKENIPVNLTGVQEECKKVDKHPKDSSIGQKNVWYSKRVLIDGEDAKALKEGENATFVNWGNFLIKKINKTGDKIASVDAEANLDNKDFKKTVKLTWLADTEKASFTPTTCIYYDHIINKPVLEKDDDFKNFIGKDTKFEMDVLGDHDLKTLNKGEIIQIQRKGYFIVDSPYKPISPNTCRPTPVRLIAIPDGTPNSYGPPGKTQAPTVKETGKKQNQTSSKSEPAAKVCGDAASLNAKITEQGNKVRDLKSKKAEKSQIDAAVKTLLDLKAQFKAATGKDWKPGMEIPSASASQPPKSGDAASINAKIGEQGNKVRDLKSKKADKAQIDAEVKTLLDLKAQFKAATGKDWKPGMDIPSTVTSQTSASGDAASINAKIAEQGNKVRDLKSIKAEKSQIDAEVKTLLDLKAQFKAATGKDWKPGMDIPSPSTNQDKSEGNDAAAINAQIVEQGNKVRDLKSKKADKAQVDAEVKTLLDLKSKFKSATGKDWKPGMNIPSTPAKQETSSSGSNDAATINAKIVEQGNKVRDLKSKKADKSQIDAAVKILLDLKAQFKSSTGKDWKPGMEVPAPTESNPINELENELSQRITLQGDLIRKLKSSKADKADIDSNVKILLDLKAKYKEKIGKDWQPQGGGNARGGDSNKKQDKSKKQQQQPKKQPPKKEDNPKASGTMKQTRLGLEAKKEEDLADWYSQIIVKSELLEYYDVSGCYILRPWAYSIWESIKNYFDAEIKKLGVENCYFPMFVSQSALEREKDHIADFSPEVAWVTKSGKTDLAEPVAIRPTSETVMYPTFAKWIQSYRDLPIKINQWCNVVRWEFKHPQPFLRTREFLWQEGHTAYAEKPEAEKEVLDILGLYRSVYEDLLAIPVVPGRKTEKEKFAGGDYTTTVEAYISAAGRSIQGATSHHLGQNFSKMFEVIYNHPDTGEKMYAYQNSWGITTRTIGVLIMVHGDNQGLVLPPRVAMIQVVIVPCGITNSLKEQDRKDLYKACEEYEDTLKKIGVRVKGDYRENYSPGWKFNHWELKGVPIRLELGPRDVKKNEYVVVRRDTGAKIVMNKSSVNEDLPKLLETIQSEMFAKAKKIQDEHVSVAEKWDDFIGALEKGHIIMAPFCGDVDCEEQIKELSKCDVEVEPGAPSMGAKSLCSPFKQPKNLPRKCIKESCKAKPQQYTLFGRSY